MTGEDLLQALSKLSPEERKLPIVVEGQDNWYYDASKIEVVFCNEGRIDDVNDYDDDGLDEEIKLPNSIAIHSY